MSPTLNIPYSGQYHATNQEGHEHPAPQFGAPTLVWHLGISPHWPDERPAYDSALQVIHEALAKTYEETRTVFFEEVNRILEALQTSAGLPSSKLQKFNPLTIPQPWDRRTTLGDPFYVASPGSIRFMLWWSRSGVSADPTQDALRVEVHAGAHRDYVTLSFYVDASGVPAPASEAAASPGERILAEVNGVRAICEPRMASDPQGGRIVDREVVPEHGIEQGTDGAALMRASSYLFSELWDTFCKATELDKLSGFAKCRVFANFRGLVMATDGLPETAETRAFAGSSGAEPFPRFVGNGGIEHTGARSAQEPNEANAVVKAYRPLVRRATPDADSKEFIACGVMSWRALFVTSLNDSPSLEAGGAEGRREEPIRYLLLTKNDPHRRQIGRVVERINSMGTMRLIALRDYNIIRDASTHIQLRGQELDTMMRKWSNGRAGIREKFEVRRKGKKGEALTEIQDAEDKEIQALADTVEKDLIDLSAALDEVGIGAVHGLHFRINRSRYYVDEFESLLKSLKVGNIDTWVSYEQFVTRGLKPAFDFIDGVGARLLGLRTRLQSVLEGIETSALVKQTAATRENTAQLKTIARAFTRLHRLLRLLGVIIAATSLFVTLLGLQGYLARMMGWLVRP